MTQTAPPSSTSNQLGDHPLTAKIALDKLGPLGLYCSHNRPGIKPKAATAKEATMTTTTTTTEYLTVPERARAIRAQLKKFGWNRTHVSVRCGNGGGSIRVTILSTEPAHDTVDRVTREQESIRWCEYSGEILAGGNIFVTVGYDQELIDRYVPAVEAWLEALEADDRYLTRVPVLAGEHHDHRFAQLMTNGWYYLGSDMPFSARAAAVSLVITALKQSKADELVAAVSA